MKRLLTAATAAVLGLSLVGCTVVDEKRPESTGYASTSEEPVPEESTAAGAPALTLVDASAGGPKKEDPLWQKLDEAAAGTKQLYMWLWMQTDSKIGTSGDITITPSAPKSVSVTLPASTVKAEHGFAKIVGTFTVKKKGEGAYALTADSTDEIASLTPKGKSTQERCTQGDAQDRIGGAADKLSQDPGARENLRRQWIASPEVWWAIQEAARNLRESNGDFEGDSFSVACEAYVEGG